MGRFLMTRKGLPKEDGQQFPSGLYNDIAEETGSKKDPDEMTNPETKICIRKARNTLMHKTGHWKKTMRATSV